jgi:hypothetical protein
MNRPCKKERPAFDIGPTSFCASLSQVFNRRGPSLKSCQARPSDDVAHAEWRSLYFSNFVVCCMAQAGVSERLPLINGEAEAGEEKSFAAPVAVRERE